MAGGWWGEMVEWKGSGVGLCLVEILAQNLQGA